MEKVIVLGMIPRNGSSLTMQDLADAFGESCIAGKKFPQERKEEDLKTPHQKFTYNKRDFKKHNPGGFYEDIALLSRGINSTPNIKEHLKEKCESVRAVKMLPKGVANTDPDMVEKMIVTIRNPLEVKASWENFGDKREWNPSIYINGYRQIASWILKNPSIPVHVVDYADRIEDNKKVIKGLSDFIGVPIKKSNFDATKIEPAKDIDTKIYRELKKLYAMLKESDWQGIVDRAKEFAPKFRIPWECERTGKITDPTMCKLCMENIEVRRNFIKASDHNDVDWQEKHCAVECGAGGNSKDFISIEESINNNFWVSGETKTYIGQKYNSLIDEYKNHERDVMAIESEGLTGVDSEEHSTVGTAFDSNLI